MAIAPNEFETLRADRLSENSPESEIDNEWLRGKTKFLEEYIRGQKLVAGVADANPIAPDFGLVDAVPSFGALTDIVVGQTLKITSGKAEEKRFKITNVDIPNDEIECTENLFDEGVRSGDTYVVIFSTPQEQDEGHNHDGVDSVLIPQPNLGILFLFG